MGNKNSENCNAEKPIELQENSEYWKNTRAPLETFILLNADHYA